MKNTVWLRLLLVLCMIVQLMALPIQAVMAAEDISAGDLTAEVSAPRQKASEKTNIEMIPDGIRVLTFDAQENEIARSGVIHNSKEAAAQEARQYLKSRQEEFTVCLQTSSHATEKMIEDIMVEAFKHTADPEEGDYLEWQCEEWSASVNSIKFSSTYQHSITFRVKYYTTAQQEAQVTAAVEQLLRELNVGDKGSYEKIKAVYDYLCSNVSYDYENLNNAAYTLKFTAYGALVDKKAVCQGYAVLMYRLLLELGVDNRVIAGVSGGEAHGWNIAKIGELYYNLDATWDAQSAEHKYLLRNRENFADHRRYLEYETIAFHQKYPMSDSDYTAGVPAEAESVIASGSCGENAFWKLNRDGSLSITGNGAIKDYPYGSNDLSVLPPWIFWETEIHTVTVGEGITDIGTYSFCEMPALTSVSLPKTLERVGECAFLEAEALKNITIPSGVKCIENSAFRNCRELTAITIPDSVTTMDVACFHGCSKLKTVVLGAGLTEINNNMFYGCSALESIEIPQGVKKISEKAFDGCTSLQKITIPKSVTEVANGAFGGCASLEKVVFEGNPNLGMDLFLGGYALKRVYFYGDAPQFHVRTFSGITATCYYPKDNATWTSGVLQNYDGVISWVISCGNRHEPVIDQAVAAGCTSTGLTEGKHCSACGEEIISQEITAALGHAFGQWTQVQAPSVDAEGKEQRTCSRCGAAEDRPLPKLDPPATTQPKPTQTTAPSTTAPTVPVQTTAAATQPTTGPAALPTTVATQPTTVATRPTNGTGDAEGTVPVQSGGAAQEEPRSLLPAVLVVTVLLIAGGAGAAWFFVLRKRK